MLLCKGCQTIKDVNAIIFHSFFIPLCESCATNYTINDLMKILTEAELKQWIFKSLNTKDESFELVKKELLERFQVTVNE